MLQVGHSCEAKGGSRWFLIIVTVGIHTVCREWWFGSWVPVQCAKWAKQSPMKAARCTAPQLSVVTAAPHWVDLAHTVCVWFMSRVRVLVLITA